MPMKTLFLSVLSFALLIPALSYAERNPDVVRAEKWLNALKTAQSEFVQIAPDGTQRTGSFYISRPGKLRFEYRTEPKDFIVADGVFLYYYDATSGQQSNAPIGATLADFLLRPNMSMNGDVSVQRVFKTSDLTQITLVQTDSPDTGKLIMGFQHKPYQLKKWQVIDSSGAITQVDLEDMNPGIKLDDSLFRYVDPKLGKSRNLNQ